MMALKDRSYDITRPDPVSSPYLDTEMNNEDNFNIEDTSDGFDGRMIGNIPLEASRESYDSVDYASKLKMKSSNEKHHVVGGGGGGATYIFKVHRI